MTVLEIRGSASRWHFSKHMLRGHYSDMYYERYHVIDVEFTTKHTRKMATFRLMRFFLLPFKHLNIGSRVRNQDGLTAAAGRGYNLRK